MCPPGHEFYRNLFRMDDEKQKRNEKHCFKCHPVWFLFGFCYACRQRENSHCVRCYFEYELLFFLIFIPCFDAAGGFTVFVARANKKNFWFPSSSSDDAKYESVQCMWVIKGIFPATTTFFDTLWQLKAFATSTKLLAEKFLYLVQTKLVTRWEDEQQLMRALKRSYNKAFS